MPLTKKDLSQIRGVVHGEVTAAVETLAQIVNKAFQGVEKRFEFVDKRLEIIEAEIRHINARLNVIEHDIADIKKHLIHQDDFEALVTRVSFIEKRLGVTKNKVKI